jgi:hypothetical protein
VLAWALSRCNTVWQASIEQELSKWTGNWVDLWDEEAGAADAVPPAPAAGAQEGAMVWEYFHDQHWYAYDRASTAALNAARRAGERTVLLEPWGVMNRESKTYCVDLENMLQTQMQTRTVRPVRCVHARASHSARTHGSPGNGGAPRLALARRNVCLQPPAWAPNVDVELELSGAADPAEILDFSSAVKAVAFAPDGSCVAAGCHDGQIRTVRLNTQERNLAGICAVCAHV